MARKAAATAPRTNQILHGDALTVLNRRWRDCVQPPQAHREFPWAEALALLDDAFGRWPDGSEPSSGDVDYSHHDRLLDWPSFWKDEATEPQWLLQPLVAEGQSTALVSTAKVGKSLLALEGAAALATGRPFLGSTVEPVDVLYVDHENTREDLRSRLDALGYGPDDDLSALLDTLVHYIPAPIGDLRMLAGDLDAGLGPVVRSLLRT